MISRPSVAAAVVGLALAVAGCGSHKSATARLAKVDDCMSQAGHARTDEIVRGLIARGAIPEREVARKFRGIPRSDYLDSEGKLLPFSRMPTDAQTALASWVVELESQAGGRKIFDAEMNAVKAAKGSCSRS